LIDEGWISIDRQKRGHSNGKAFLSKEGKKIVQNRLNDFELLFVEKETDSFVFSPTKNHQQSLSRETFTRQINQVMKIVSKRFPNKPHITSHSLRVGYIEDLWRDLKDIEYAKYKIGRRKILRVIIRCLV
jgi:hypothetical protein